MFTWLFRKENTEQKQKKEIDNIVRAMCRSVTEEGRWDVKVWRCDKVYGALVCDDVFKPVLRQSFHIVEMVDAKTGWKMLFNVDSDIDVHRYSNLSLKCSSRVREEKVLLTDIEDILHLSPSQRILSVVVENHSLYENIPSDEQLKEVYDVWWWKVVASESQRRYEEKQKQKLEQKQTAIDKLKQMYL